MNTPCEICMTQLPIETAEQRQQFAINMICVFCGTCACTVNISPFIEEARDLREILIKKFDDMFTVLCIHSEINYSNSQIDGLSNVEDALYIMQYETEKPVIGIFVLMGGRNLNIPRMNSIIYNTKQKCVLPDEIMQLCGRTTRCVEHKEYGRLILHAKNKQSVLETKNTFDRDAANECISVKEIQGSTLTEIHNDTIQQVTNKELIKHRREKLNRNLKTIRRNEKKFNAVFACLAQKCTVNTSKERKKINEQKDDASILITEDPFVGYVEAPVHKIVAKIVHARLHNPSLLPSDFS